MTALTSDTREAAGRLESLTSLTWVTWRQHRTALTWFGALMLALGTAILIIGIRIHGLYAAELRHGCLGSSAWSAVCRPLQNPFADGWTLSYSSLVVLAMQAVPVITGVFLGAPLLAREYASGTVRFTWTQGIGRTRWAAMTLGLLGGAVAAGAGLLGLLTQWSVQPVAVQAPRYADRWEPGFFDHTVLTAAAAALLAFVIGVLAGALIKRVVAAMAVTAVCVITVADLTYNRLHYWLMGRGILLARDQAFGAYPNVAVQSSGMLAIREPVGPSAPGPAGAWLDQGWYTSANAHRLDAGTVTQLLNRYTGTGTGWLTRLHDTFWITYQPGSRYWIFQLVLAGGTLLAALLLGAAIIGLIRHQRA
jgi:hypothetical protein